MARKTITDLAAWPSLSLEGNLIAPAMVAQISQPKDDAETQQSYGVRKGLTIREEISTAFRVGQSHFDAFAKQQNPSAEATRRFVRDFLKETFGFDDLAPGSGTVAFLAGGRVPIVVVTPEERLDRRSPTLSTDRSRSPAVALQDYLNAEDSALWGLVTNGHLIRLMRDNASLTRPAYIEADLTQIFTTEDAASFAALWLVVHRSRFGLAGAPATDCSLERWRDTGAKEGEAARNRLAGQVELALAVLGSGFLEANPELARLLKSGEVNLTDWFNELLRLVYRLIFLMVAEDRNLLIPEKANPEARRLYAEGYSLTTLRAQCVRRASWDKHHDRYEGIKIVFHGLARGQEALALPALGGLFSEDKLPRLVPARLRNRAFMEGLFRLSWLTDGTVLVPVNWRAMETEELGSVYESLLELQPQLAPDGKTLVFASEPSEQKGNQRKTTGSYYTPDSLVQALLDTALDPVLDKTEAEATDPAKALLKLSVIDPACGSGHFLLAAARRIATRLARIRAEGTPSLSDFRHALRDVTRCCIHGVDRNPMAVELTKVALWIETVDPGLPLGFFDAQIRCGDSLVGVFDLKVLQDGIPDAAYMSLSGDDKDTAKYYLQANQAVKAGQGGFDFGTGRTAMPETKPLAVDFSSIRELPEDTLEQIGTKTAQFERLQASDRLARLRLASNLYIGAFLAPKVGSVPTGPSSRLVPTTEELWKFLSRGELRSPMDEVSQIAHLARAFHWPLEFPDTMQRGGFDVVLGNPPWERIKLEEKEFFAARDPEIAAAKNKAGRDRLIKALAAAEAGSSKRILFEEFEREKRFSEAISVFVRMPNTEGGRFPYTGTGDVNTYALFAELFSNLYRQRGQAGVMVPTGISTNDTTAPFFDKLVTENRLVSLFAYSEIKAWFSGTKDNQSFCLLTLGKADVAEFCFRIDTADDTQDHRRRFKFSTQEIVHINPNTRTAPVFRSRADAELIAKIYEKIPVLIDEAKGPQGNPWGAIFPRLFDMSNDSGLFLNAAQLGASGFRRDGVNWIADETISPKGARYVPLYEAKMVSYFDSRWGYYPDGADDDTRALPRPSEEQKKDPAYDISPRLWVPSEELESRLLGQGWNAGWMIVHRSLTNNTNERTFITSVIPRRGAGNSVPVWIFPSGSDWSKCAALYANTTCVVLDYVVRNKIGGTNLNLFYLKQFPLVPPSYYTPLRLAYLMPRVLELTYTSRALEPFARDLGHTGQVFAWDENRRALLRADIDAFFARAYGLTRDELRYILDPADVKGADYPSETFRVLKERESRQFGEYRTRRLVIEAWDRMEGNGDFAAMGM